MDRIRAVGIGDGNEVVARWLLVDDPAPLETVYPTLRALLLRSVGVDEVRIAVAPELGR